MSERAVLSVLMPVYNEARTVLHAIDRLEAIDPGVPMELVIVDDGSTDGSAQLVADRAERSPWIRAAHHESNRGKGSAVRTATAMATGRLVCVYDADLEYDPRDIVTMLQPLLEGRAEVVYGVRAFGGHGAHSYWYVLGNRALTTAANVLFNTYLRDLCSCFKMLDLEVFRSLDLRSEGFTLEAEMTAKLLARGHRIYEVPISYMARSHEEGKKLRATDGFRILATIAGIRLRAAGNRKVRPPARAGSTPSRRVAPRRRKARP